MLRICEATDDPRFITETGIRSLIFLTVFSHDKYTKSSTNLQRNCYLLLFTDTSKIDKTVCNDIILQLVIMLRKK